MNSADKGGNVSIEETRKQPVVKEDDEENKSYNDNTNNETTNKENANTTANNNLKVEVVEDEIEIVNENTTTNNRNKDEQTTTTTKNASHNDTNTIKRLENPMEKASLFSRLLFIWPYPLLKLGMKRSLEDSDLPDIPLSDTSKTNRIYFDKLWNEELQACRNRNEKDKNSHRSPNLHSVVLKDFFKSIWYIHPLMMFAQTAKVVQAIALGLLIETFESRSNSINHYGFLWASILVFCGLIILFEHHHVFFITWRKGMQYRIAIIQAIYEKSLRLSSTHQDTTANYGKIMNLASNDVERFILACLFISYLLWSPLQAIGILIVGCIRLGPAFAAGFGLLVIVFVPLQMYLSNRFGFFRSKIASLTDERVNFVSQAINGVRVMKMSGYEYKFLTRIQSIREKEINQIKQANHLRAVNESLFYCANIVISVIIFFVHIVFIPNSRPLTPGDVFMVFTLVNILQLEMTKHVSLGVMGVSECYVSITRIQNFLQFPELPRRQLEEEVQPEEKTAGRTLSFPSLPVSFHSNSDNNGCVENNDDIIPEKKMSERTAISMSNITCYWNDVERHNKKNASTTLTVPGESGEDKKNKEDLTRPELYLALSNITLNCYMSELTCIIGTVGSGKSALIQAIVGELPVYSGVIHRHRRCVDTNTNVNDNSLIAYASQDPWIMNGTVKENIILGNIYNKDWYNEVVTACGLIIDFNQLRNGDETIVGDKGVQISGGQRARIGLARAIYMNTNILVVDDPLSAVDSKVGRQLFYDALIGLCIKKGKCVILATHQHQYLHDDSNSDDNKFVSSSCIKCVMMEKGRIVCIGTYNDCVEKSNGKLKIVHSANSTIDDSMENILTSGTGTSEEAEGNGFNDVTSQQQTESLLGNDNKKKEEKGFINYGDTQKADNNTATDNDGQEEIKVKGTVRFRTYLDYVRAMGGLWAVFFLFLLYCGAQTSVLVTITTMARWAERPPSEQKSWDIIGLVLGLAGIVIILTTIRAIICFRLFVKASQRLHDKMARAVLRSKIEFFDTNPLGRILNRFSADVGSNDDLLPVTLFDFLVVFFIVVGAVVTTVITLPFTLIVIPPLLWYFISVRRVFITSSRELKRLEGIARSPIFAMLGEALAGIATIRGNNAIGYFQKKFEVVHDSHTRAFFSFIASSRWLGFRMDGIMFLFMSLVSVLAVLVDRQEWFSIDPAVLGLAISMLLQLAGLFQWCIRQSAEVVNQMVSVERVVAFGDLDSEGDLNLESDKNLSGKYVTAKSEEDRQWPVEGKIEVNELSVRYRSNLPLALDKASFCIPGGARVGIVGRTGSGKSTIVQTLFRLLEAESGCILFDGMDISKVGLHTLRTKISVIPQLPTLFSGCSVRENLDLFNIHSDTAVRDALKAAHMDKVVEELPNGWDSPVSEGGSNFSVGQRQLLCLARAILSKNKILILDEATASVDRRTDEMLQEALKESFKDSTIIAVAHRLETVIDMDLILVLGGGKVLEYGSPKDLIQKGNNGVFATMVNDTGDKMSADLRRRALEANR